ncbi:hypothetical protein KJ951_01785 [Patescibacteria group bacterium]|nr:hypothetical protein [Patescibacteria group bacterium]MBU1703110.1 hypothetical protein [Patescibacteria group bacterium]MBU1953745.1 hypothetical protein [Patescibacteria group bacterium]
MQNLLAYLSDKFGVDLAKIDPNESMRQVMAWYPNKRLYERTSSKSGKKIVSVYSENALCPVFSHDEWYSDDWSSPFLEIDFNKPFFEQFKELQKRAPVVSLLSNLQENAEYCHDCEGLKNCYLVFDALNCRDVYYSTRIYNSRDCVDVYWIMDSELIYDSVYLFNCYNVRFSFNCRQVSDSAFSYNCRNVQNSFMCSNLRNKQYCVNNEQLTKEQYGKFMLDIDFRDYSKVLEMKKEFREKIVARAPMSYAIMDNCENASGNYLRNSASTLRCFESFDMKDAYNNFQCAMAKDMVGSFMCNDRVENCFQCVATGIASYEVKNCAFVWHSSFMEYCYLCLNSSNCFGCIGLKNKQYHIFNKPYSKEEYIERTAVLRDLMRKRGEYGKFFPMSLSPFPYEDTIAFDLFDDKESDYFGRECEVGAGATNGEQSGSVQSCIISGKKFKYLSQELDYYKKHFIALPRVSPVLRYKQRMEIMDTSFTPKEILVGDEKVSVFFEHPEKKNIVTESEYEKSLV